MSDLKNFNLNEYNQKVNKVLENRYEIIVIIEAHMCNPNGDPNMGNRPRTDHETNVGIITDTAIKSLIRKYIKDAYWDVENCKILMRDGVNLNEPIAEAVITVSADTEGKKSESQKQEDAAQYMCMKFWDVRAFGGVLSTGLNAGQVRGAVQVSMACSVDPIETRQDTITRKCYAELNSKNLEDYDKKDSEMDPAKKRTMGTKTYTPFGLYVVKFSISANVAQKTGFTEDDMSKLLEGIMQMYNNNASSSKMGMSVLSPIVVFKHVGTGTGNEIQNRNEALLGCTSSQRLFNLVEIKRKEDVTVPRSYKDYDITLDLSKLPKGVKCGVKREFYDDVDWLDITEKIPLLEA